MALHVVKRGLDIPIKGRATGEPVAVEAPATVAYSPTEFAGVTPRLAAREGDEVKQGQPLFTDKLHTEMKFLSPVAGRVKEIRRGKRRVILDVVVERSGDEAVSFKAWSAGELAGISRTDAAAQLLAGGLWPLLRTRPLDRVATPGTVPQSILVGGMDTGPAMPGAEELVSAADGDALQAGIHVLKALTDGKVFLTVRQGRQHPAFAKVAGAEVHEFAGPHPAGHPPVQVNYVDPPRGTNQVWWLHAWDAVLIGRLFLEGKFPSERVYAAGGVGVKAPRLVKTLLGAPLQSIVGAVEDGPMRWIRGSVLTGQAVSSDRWASFYNRGVHVLPDEVQREVLGWATPRLGLFSAHRAYLAGFFKATRDYDLRPGLFGGVRAIVPNDAYARVVATPDIAPIFLFKAIMAGDMEESVQLGMLDITREEAALCTYVCPSKNEYDVLLAEGLEQYAKEL